MEIIRCAVVDDKPLALDLIVDYIEKFPNLSLKLATTKPLEALEMVMAGKIDLVFLDIQMPQLSGVQFMKISQGKCKVVLTTAYSKYAIDGFENDAVDYLMKPISFERFYKAVQKVQTELSKLEIIKNKESDTTKDFIFVKTEYKLVKINIDEILYVEGMQNYVAIYTQGDKIISLQNIKKTEEQLPGKYFVRIHKSYIVALKWIDSVERSRVYIKGGVLPLGDVYRDNFFNAINFQ